MNKVKSSNVIALVLMLTLIGCKTGDPTPEKLDEEKSEAKTGREKGPGARHAALKPKAKKSNDVSDYKDQKAPEKFAVKLNTTKGDIIIDVTRAWTPHGADRFYTLVTDNYYNDTAFFRVVEGFMVQVGVSGNPVLNTMWRKRGAIDDPVVKSNTRGMVSFAATGKPNSRTTQFFVNFGDNGRLDRMGFPPFGKVRDMKIVETLYKGYGEGAPKGNGPVQSRVHSEGNEYLQKDFPKLDYILSATLLEE